MTNQSILIYTVHKAASMFMHGITVRVCAALGIPYYSPNHEQYFSEIIGSGWNSFLEKPLGQACYGQIRPGEAEPCIPSNLDDYRVVLHLRDPRDALTSLYYSVAYSHPRKEGGFNPSDEQREQWVQEGVDKYALDHYKEIRERYSLLMENIHGRPNVVFVKYEEMIVDFSDWLRRFLLAFEHVPAASARRWGPLSRETRLGRLHRKLVAQYGGEFAPPAAENIHSHKRQVIPGDYLRKLQPATIDKLDSEFAAILRKLEYTR